MGCSKRSCLRDSFALELRNLNVHSFRGSIMQKESCYNLLEPVIVTVEYPFTPPRSFYYQCNATAISLAFKSDPLGKGVLINPQSLYLGTCNPSSTTVLKGYFVFEYSLRDCSFAFVKYDNIDTYNVRLMYIPPNDSPLLPKQFEEMINCTFIRIPRPTPYPVTQIVSKLSGVGNLMFTYQIMEDDFSQPSSKKVFVLGYPISIQLSVQTSGHLPLQIYVDYCTVAPTRNLSEATRTYSLINNHGCFIDGKEASSVFVKRPSPGVIRLVFQAFQFLDFDTDLFLHFSLVVWDPLILTDPSKKACSFIRNSNRWELLDNPAISSLCRCCDTNCKSRKRRDIQGEVQSDGLVHNVVLGPIQIRSSYLIGTYEWKQNESRVTESESKVTESKSDVTVPPVVGALIIEVVALMIVLIGVALYSRKAMKNSETESTWLVAPDNSESS
ncbi:zona pellucida sperm-binding protein 3 [Bombina bombina]|uniref:zona pellucida sperm-binding protein 3 n=1 Tax=Bombina bombina TaxID=8345 RepID=UPI00235A80CF|nr:zona pellucida sperm-binding protein 3 [Bombina bombina]